jgi:hypothetical protein
VDESRGEEDAGCEGVAPAEDSVARSAAASQERERASDSARCEDREQKSEFDAKHELLDDFLVKQ